MTDTFEGFADSLSTPPAHGYAVTPDDALDLPFSSRCINVAQSGTVRLTTVRGDTIDVFIAAGGVFPVRAERIHATGTTAGGLVVMY